MSHNQALQEAKTSHSVRAAGVGAVGPLGGMLVVGLICIFLVPMLAMGLSGLPGSSGLYLLSGAVAAGVAWLVARSGRRAGGRARAFYVEMEQRGRDLLEGARLPAGV